jgi:hypothetical protein
MHSPGRKPRESDAPKAQPRETTMRRYPPTCAPILTALLTLTALHWAAAQEPGPRFLIRPDRIGTEQGFCYIASMDFGEDGDRETGNKSGLVLYEDGKPLGPARSYHADIRTKGGGRYSHWTATALYFSASDNSNPRTNGRRYEVASTNPESTLGKPPLPAARTLQHTEVIAGSQRAWTLRLGGTLDYDTTATRFNDNLKVGFQPNVALTIANTGDTPVRWPKLIANSEKDWSTYESLLEDFTRGATTDQEKALFIWQRARWNRHHELPLFPDAEFHDPVKMFNSYGLNLCDDMGFCGCSLFKHAGLGKPKYSLDPKVRHLNGHMQCEAVVDNAYQFLDIDESVFYLDRECARPVSGDECARDHDLVRREVLYGPVFPGWDASDSNAALFGADDGQTSGFIRQHEMSYTLRPGEQVTFRWDNVGKWAAGGKDWSREPNYFGNSRFSYTPRLGIDRLGDMEAEARELAAGTSAAGKLAGATATARLEVPMRTPWVICGGTVRAQFEGLEAGDKFALEVSVDGKTFVPVWSGEGTGVHEARASLDEALLPHELPAKYAYRLAVLLQSASERKGANLCRLQVETDVMANPLSLPGLRLGENQFVYTDQEERPHEVTVTQQWQESDYTRPAAPVAVSPAAGETVRATLVPFRWEPVAGCRRYWLQVSQREDFRLPYRPAYDVIVDASEWCVPYSGMFAPDATYYWRLRSCDRKGVWSDWTAPQTFTWEGPKVPRNVRLEPSPDGLVLRWEPNPHGTRPVAYDVYASDEKGFSVHKTEYTSYLRGKVAANLVTRVEGTELAAVTTAPTLPNQNRCYWRVVAVDANGVESICSDYAEAPHPSFCSKPRTDARVGEVYEYVPTVISSLGDCQHDGKANTTGWVDGEAPTFTLAEGPAWLSCDAQTGRVSGTPPTAQTAKVVLEARTRQGKTARQEFVIGVR